MGTVKRLATKPFVVMPLLAVLVLGGWWAWTSRTGDETVASATSTQLVAATTGTMSRTVSAEGTVAVAQSDDLSFSASGTVTAVNVAAGQAVKAGDVLATIDSAELEAAVADAETTLAEAQSKQYDDYVAGASSSQQLADQTAVTTAQDRLAAANEDLAGAQLVASFDGTVSTVDLTVGEELGTGGTGGTTPTGSASGSGQSAGTLGSSSTGAQTGGAGATGTSGSSTSTAQIQVVSASSYVVDLGLDDTDIANVAVGQQASITLSTATSSSSAFPGGFGGAFPGGLAGGANAGGQARTGTGSTGTGSTGGAATTPQVRSDAATGKGTVTEVGQVADASTGVATYPVTVSFTDATGNFNAGATVQVEITYAQATDVIQVPAFAVTTSGGTSTVKVSVDGEEQQRTVKTGLTSGTMVEITSGLAEGEQVVVAMRGPGGLGGSPPSGGQMPQGFPGAPTGATTDTTVAASDG